MAKKFGKLLLLSAAIGSVAGAVYYFKKKEAEQNDIDDDDYDDFDDDQDDDADSSRSYVSLNPDAAAEKAPESEGTEGSGKNASGEVPENDIPTGQNMFKEYASASGDEFFEETSSATESSQENSQNENNSQQGNNSQNGNFTPLTGQIAEAADKIGENVEEFFDEEDAPGVEPPINDN